MTPGRFADMVEGQAQKLRERTTLVGQKLYRQAVIDAWKIYARTGGSYSEGRRELRRKSEEHLRTGTGKAGQ